MNDSPSKTTDEDELFVRQCAEAGERLTELLFSYPKPVAVCVLPGVLASVLRTLGLPRDVAVAMLDSALEDIDNGR
jgi:hypothetical protein